MRTGGIVYIVEDDPQMCESLGLALRSVALAVEAYPNGEQFLARFRGENQPGCLVADIRLPGMSGIQLYRTLKAREFLLPTIFITAFGDVELAVQAMKEGAFDFLVKPFSAQTFLDRVREALEMATQWQTYRDLRTRFQDTFRKLKPREKQVLTEVLAGKDAKQIARQIGIGRKSVLRYRAQLLEKFGVDSVIELVRLAQQAGWLRDDALYNQHE